jgi:hypothetical protein
MKLLLSTLAACLVSTTAFAGTPKLDVKSDSGSVTLIRGAQVFDALSEPVLENDVIVSKASGSYQLSLENCSALVEGETTLDVANVSCEDGEFYFIKDGQVNPIVIAAGLIGGVVLITEVTNDDDNGSPASP